jgi:hypothetical protein
LSEDVETLTRQLASAARWPSSRVGLRVRCRWAVRARRSPRRPSPRLDLLSPRPHRRPFRTRVWVKC